MVDYAEGEVLTAIEYDLHFQMNTYFTFQCIHENGKSLIFITLGCLSTIPSKINYMFWVYNRRFENVALILRLQRFPAPC